MKIFSLETKKHLVGWSVALSLVINVAVMRYTSEVQCYGSHDDNGGCVGQSISGWPFPVSRIFGAPKNVLYKTVFIENLLFWFLVILIILFLIRYFYSKRKESG